MSRKGRPFRRSRKPKLSRLEEREAWWKARIERVGMKNAMNVRIL
jgi:hypothetical protein